MDFTNTTLGGAEVINWARCIIKMERKNHSVCTLSVPKRGNRSGLQRNKKPADHIDLKHAEPSPSQPGKPVFRWEWMQYPEDHP